MPRYKKATQTCLLTEVYSKILPRLLSCRPTEDVCRDHGLPSVQLIAPSFLLLKAQNGTHHYLTILCEPLLERLLESLDNHAHPLRGHVEATGRSG